MKFARNPGSASTPRAAMDLIKDWLHARERMGKLQINDVSPLEAEQALRIIVERIVQRDDGFAYRLNKRLHDRIEDTPSKMEVADFVLF